VTDIHAPSGIRTHNHSKLAAAGIGKCSIIRYNNIYKYDVTLPQVSAFCGLPQGANKVKESRNRPDVAKRVPGGLGYQIFMTFGT
jgi:hypothetical protein